MCNLLTSIDPYVLEINSLLKQVNNGILISDNICRFGFELTSPEKALTDLPLEAKKRFWEIFPSAEEGEYTRRQIAATELKLRVRALGARFEENKNKLDCEYENAQRNIHIKYDQQIENETKELLEKDSRSIVKRILHPHSQLQITEMTKELNQSKEKELEELSKIYNEKSSQLKIAKEELDSSIKKCERAAKIVQSLNAPSLVIERIEESVSQFATIQNEIPQVYTQQRKTLQKLNGNPIGLIHFIINMTPIFEQYIKNFEKLKSQLQSLLSEFDVLDKDHPKFNPELRKELDTQLAVFNGLLIHLQTTIDQITKREAELQNKKFKVIILYYLTIVKIYLNVIKTYLMSILKGLEWEKLDAAAQLSILAKESVEEFLSESDQFLIRISKTEMKSIPSVYPKNRTFMQRLLGGSSSISTHRPSHLETAEVSELLDSQINKILSQSIPKIEKFIRSVKDLGLVIDEKNLTEIKKETCALIDHLEDFIKELTSESCSTEDIQTLQSLLDQLKELRDRVILPQIFPSL